jgi:transcriptional regulator with XRE-family HTH domain
MYRDDKIRSEMAIQRLDDQDMAAKTGLARQTIALYRKGEIKDPTLSSLTAITNALGKDIAWVVEAKPETEQRAA